MTGQRVSSSLIPERFHGEWFVEGFRDPDGSGGPTPDSWRILADQIETPDFTFTVASVQGNLEPDQDLHLLSFSNNGLQFALIRSDSYPHHLLVVWYLGSEEKRRFILRR
jgi:hypothetical protein